MNYVLLILFLVLCPLTAICAELATFRYLSDGSPIRINSSDPDVIAQKIREAENKILMEKNYRESKRRARRKLESSAIYQNCLIDLMPSQPTYEVRNAVKSRCTKINNEPSFWEKLKYGD